ncbi:MAG: histone deacetylase [Candidatus Aenigmarchaeota archaeon]|nr:histone deacetylase [Candidatus Aenigmarchaeota archaeon]
MKRTGVFYFYQQANRLKDFPQALEGILDKENIAYYDAVYDIRDGLYYLEPVQENLLLKAHSKDMVERVKRTDEYEGALYSVSGTVQACDKIFSGEIDNAFVFTGYGDHHAGRNFFGGGCYFNSAAIAIANLRERGVKKFAIVDTDAHHGDGSWDLFEDDQETLYTCFCDGRYNSKNNNINITIPFRISDEEYLKKVEEEFVPKAIEHKPELIFWNWGYDGTQGDYGSIGLSQDCHWKLAKLFKEIYLKK